MSFSPPVNLSYLASTVVLLSGCFGTVDPTGATDVGPALNAAIVYAASAGSPVIFIPAGTYLVNTTIVNTTGVAVEIRGQGAGTVLECGSSFNNAMFLVTQNQLVLKDMQLVGSNNSSNTNESLVCIATTSYTVDFNSFQNITFLNSYNSIVFQGSNPSFYNSFINCLFLNTNNDFVYLNNSSAPGVDLMLSHCRFLGNMVGSCWNFSLGLGSLQVSDMQISLTGTAPSGQLCYFGTPAPDFGGCNFANCVFESGGTSATTQVCLYFNGTSAHPWVQMMFSSCTLNNNASPGIVANYVTASFVSTSINCSSTTAQIQLSSGGVQNLQFSGCTFQSGVSAPFIKSLGTSTVSIVAASKFRIGAGQFCDLSSLSSGNILYYQIIGGIGNVGLSTHTLPSGTAYVIVDNAGIHT